MPKGYRKYNGTQKVEIIKRIHRENLSFKGASREYGISDRTLRDWERIYWEEGEEALLTERRGRACVASGTQKGRKPKLNKQVEEDLIAENQRLRMEIIIVFLIQIGDLQFTILLRKIIRQKRAHMAFDM